MYRYSIFALLFCIYTAIAVDVTFERSQFPTRSGDIIVVPQNIQDDSFLFLVDSMTVEKPVQGLQIEETQLADLLSSLVGGPIVNPAETLDETVAPAAHNLFNKAKANFVVFLPSVGSDVAVSFPSLKILQQRGQRIGIKKTAYPQDTIASLTTLMTGYTPSSHGIVSSEWNSVDGVHVAYSPNGAIKILNMNDQFTQSFEAQPLILSASTDFQMASALGVNNRNPFGNNFAIYWNQKIGDFDSVYGGSIRGLNLSTAEVLKRLRKDNDKAAFDVNSKEDFTFLAEIEFLENMAQVLGEKENFVSLINDKIPDLFSFSFASLKALQTINGVDSPKFAAAMELLDKTLLNVFGKLTTLYSGKITFEVVFLGTPAYEKLAADEQIKSKYYSIVKDSVNKETFNTYFPSIYLLNTVDKGLVCQKVREEVENEIICTDHTTRIVTVSAAVGATATATVDYTNATIFQTVLWMSILMALAVYGAVYAIYAMDLEPDSILSRTVPKQHHQ